MPPPPALSPFYFMLACLAGWMNREQQKLIEYLEAENRVLKELAGPKRLRFIDWQRRLMAEKAKAAGRKVLETLETIVTPDMLALASTIDCLEVDVSAKIGGTATSSAGDSVRCEIGPRRIRRLASTDCWGCWQIWATNLPTTRCRTS